MGEEQGNKILVAVVMGSDSDWKSLEGGVATLCEILDKCVIGWEKTTLSVHRNAEEAGPYVKDAIGRGVKVFITAASMSAALPGGIAAWAKREAVVIGVALPSAYRPTASDALDAMVQMPPGVPVAVVGIGEPGLQKAGMLAAQILSIKADGYQEIGDGLWSYLEEQSTKKPVRKAFETSLNRQKGG